MKCSVLLAICCLVGVGMMGCDSSKPAGTTSTSNAPAPNVDKGKQFLATLKAMSPDKRQAYAAQHQDEVQNLNRSGDPTLMTQFTDLMRPAKPQ